MATTAESSIPAARQRKDLHNTGLPKHKIYKWGTLDRPGVPYLLSKKQIKIDPDYQRALSEGRVLALAQAWSWLACGALLVAEREPGEFFAFDGQHRLEAANRRSDIDELPCMVYKLDDIPAEALAFYRANCNRGAVNVFDKVRSLLRAGDQLTIDAIALMRKYGYEPSRKGGEYGVSCLGAFLLYFRSERDLFTTTWPVVVALHEGRPVLDKPLSAIMYLAKHAEPSILAKDGRERLLAVGFDKIMGGINRVAAAFERGGARIYALGVLELLNKGRRTNKFVLRDDDTDED